jgi:hypothetical protein
MRDFLFPDPNHSHFIGEGDSYYINDYEGFSEVYIEVPYMHKCPLPYKDDGKLIFPYGILNGVWSHVELRNALKLGCRILKYERCLYYTKTCNPFRTFIDTMYSKRLKYQEENNKGMAFICKILMNSLYGKFAQRYQDRLRYIHNTDENLQDYISQYDFDEVGEFFIFKIPSKPSIFCFPIWSAYITAYARLKIYDIIIEHDSILCDTDSSITFNEIISSKKLGELKVEHYLTEMISIKPKMYALDLSHEIESESDLIKRQKIEDSQVKCKGMNSKMQYQEFKTMISSSETLKTINRVFVKFRRHLRQHQEINSVLNEEKEFSLEDDKRNWKKKFDSAFQESAPIFIQDGKRSIPLDNHSRKVYKYNDIFISDDRYAEMSSEGVSDLDRL